MPTTAWKFPGTAINSVAGETGSYDWSNPGNITADDGSYAGVVLTGFGPSRTLRGSNFGFTSSDIPAGAFITGIEVKIERSASDANRINDTHVYIVPNGSAGSVSDRAGDNKADTVTKWPTSDTAAVYGSSSDTWSAGLTRAQAISSNFAVDLQATTTVGGLANVDYFQVRLTWELPVISAALNVTEASDAIATTGTVKIKGGSALTEAADSLYARIGYTAVVDWDFTASETPDPRIAWSGAANGTRIDSTGRMSYVPCNLFARSQEFDDAVWTKGNATITADATTAPDGTLTADKLIESATSGTHYIQQNVGVPGRYEVLSVHAKPAGRDWIFLALSNVGDGAYFNVATGAIGSINGTATAEIEAADNGFYRCSVKARRGGSAYNAIHACSANLTVSYAGDGTSGVYFWGAQVEPVSYHTKARAYLMSTTAAYYGPRFDYNPVTLEPLGVLSEEPRTNFLTDSEFAQGLPASRGGSVTAVPFAGLTAGTGLSLQNANPTTTYFYVTNYAAPASSPRVISVFVRMDDGGAPSFGAPSNSSPLNDFVFNLAGTVLPPIAANGGTVEDYGGGLYRVSMATTTPATPNTSCGVIKYPGNSLRGFTASGIMVEAGNDVTSYIATGTAAVARGVEQSTWGGASFAAAYNPSEGTIIVDFDRNSLASAGSRVALGIDDGTSAQRMLLYSSSVGRIVATNGSDLFPAYNLGAIPAKTRQKIALAYAANDFAGVMNGTAPQTTTSGTPPTVDRMSIGWGTISNANNGHIKRIRYYDVRVRDSELKALTALQGQSVIIETGDTLAADGKVYITAALNKIEATDALTATAQVYVKATLNKIEATDALSSAATVRIKGTLARTEANDTVAAQAKAYIRATVTIGEAGDTLAAAADAGPRAVASERRTIILLGAPLSGRTVELTGSRLADRTIII
jgi:hypothetical protein